MIDVNRWTARTLAASLLLAGLASATWAQALPDAAAVAAYAEKLLDEQKLGRDGPGVAVLVARGDQVLYRGARGMASIELGVPLSADQAFRIGSVTKQFAAAALLKLIDDGRAKLDDPLSKYVPGYPQGDKVTLLQLLNHTSGIKSYTGIPGYMDNPIRRELTTAQLIDEFKNQPIDFAPGEAWRYNNSGYVLVGAVIEAITGKTWHQFVDEALLAPNKLARTVYPGETKLIKGMASGYGVDPAEGVIVDNMISMTQPHAAGALVSTVDDLWRWNRVLHGGKVLSAASYGRMIAPEGKAAASSYGFGISSQKLRGQTLYQHGGGINGFVSSLAYLPQTQTSVVLLRNATGPGFNLDLIARKLGAFAIGSPYAEVKPIKVAAEQLKAFEGVYALDDKQTRTLAIRDGKLMSTRSGGRPTELVPIGRDEFLFDNSVARFTVARDAAGKVAALKLYQDGEGVAEDWKRTGELPVVTAIALSPDQQQALLGEYASPQFQIKVFKDEQGVLRGQAPGQPAFELKATTPVNLYVTQVDAKLEFVLADGRANQVTLLQGPTKLVMQRR